MRESSPFPPAHAFLVTLPPEPVTSPSGSAKICAAAEKGRAETMIPPLAEVLKARFAMLWLLALGGSVRGCSLDGGGAESGMRGRRARRRTRPRLWRRGRERRRGRSGRGRGGNDGRRRGPRRRSERARHRDPTRNPTRDQRGPTRPRQDPTEARWSTAEERATRRSSAPPHPPRPRRSPLRSRPTRRSRADHVYSFSGTILVAAPVTLTIQKGTLILMESTAALVVALGAKLARRRGRRTNRSSSRPRTSAPRPRRLGVDRARRPCARQLGARSLRQRHHREATRKEDYLEWLPLRSWGERGQRQQRCPRGHVRPSSTAAASSRAARAAAATRSSGCTAPAPGTLLDHVDISEGGSRLAACSRRGDVLDEPRRLSDPPARAADSTSRAAMRAGRSFCSIRRARRPAGKDSRNQGAAGR